MPRMGRIVVPGMPHHVVQRGHNRQVVFAAQADFNRYLKDLCELKAALDVKLHAWCLMTNHVHLLLTPPNAAALGQLMKALAARATRFRNKVEGRSGTLWESRYKSSVVDSDEYLLGCCRYIELNPVKAGMVRHPALYEWSSYRDRMRVGGAESLDLDSQYLAMGTNNALRQEAYAQFVRAGIPAGEQALISGAVQRGQLTGGGRFVDEIEKITGLRVENQSRGRPRWKR